VNGWRTLLPLSPEDAIRSLEPFFGEFLFTNIDREGLMQGIDRPSVHRVRAATKRVLTVAGGVTTHEEIEWLHEQGIDAVVGMALYAGRLATPPASPPSNPGGEENR
jgi:phosphoribosylformimino-5-aminoimidazole carboxamide ribonucleotide (ProFAR) isomerase